jgi:hypothetical protein
MSLKFLAAAAFAAFAFAASPAVGEEVTVIELTQTACQFIESENGIDHGFKTSSKADCDVVNDASGDRRLAQAKVLELKPGKYVFRVTNRDVPYDLGFWLRGAGLIGRATLPSVSGGGLTTGGTKDYAVELKEGEYLYSCPLNPTPDYKIVVTG